MGEVLVAAMSHEITANICKPLRKLVNGLQHVRHEDGPVEKRSA